MTQLYSNATDIHKLINNFNPKLIFITIVLLKLILFTSCTTNLKGVRGCSSNIDESKKNKYFLNSYEIILLDYLLFNKHKVFSDDIFVEKGFGWGNTPFQTQDTYYGYLDGKYQIVLPIFNDSIVNYLHMNNIDFKPLQAKAFCSKSGDCLFCPIDSSMIKDTIIINIYKKDINKPVGNFTIVKIR